MNLYQYVGSTPVNGIDPMGTDFGHFAGVYGVNPDGSRRDKKLCFVQEAYDECADAAKKDYKRCTDFWKDYRNKALDIISKQWDNCRKVIEGLAPGLDYAYLRTCGIGTSAEQSAVLTSYAAGILSCSTVYTTALAGCAAGATIEVDICAKCP